MRFVWAFLVVACLLASPFAHAVECVMTRTPQDAALAAMPADCPMFAAAMAAKAPTLSVADCVKAPALGQAEVNAPAVEHSPGAPLPVERVAMPLRPRAAPAHVRPPPDYGLGPFSHRVVLLETSRLRP